MPRHRSILANFSYVNGVVKVDLENKILNKLQKGVMSDITCPTSLVRRRSMIMS